MKQNNETSCSCFQWSRERIVVSVMGGGKLTSMQCKPIQNCHNESPQWVHPSKNGKNNKKWTLWLFFFVVVGLLLKYTYRTFKELSKAFVYVFNISMFLGNLLFCWHLFSHLPVNSLSLFWSWLLCITLKLLIETSSEIFLRKHLILVLSLGSGCLRWLENIALAR
jgi:hypothetical protein